MGANKFTCQSADRLIATELIYTVTTYEKGDFKTIILN
jgi:hypothetical protein